MASKPTVSAAFAALRSAVDELSTDADGELQRYRSTHPAHVVIIGAAQRGAPAPLYRAPKETVCRFVA